MAYIPLFKKIPVEPKTSDKIGQVQKDFEAFWLPLNKSITPNAEKSLGMRKLQEACMWLSRSVAATGEPKKPAGLCAPSTVE
tara:strand:+ start:2963 stop:3208 length:246 start_codon:yes stop_codon:yes gene_type:complete